MEDVLTIPTIMSAERNNNITSTIKAYSRQLFGFIKQRVATNEDAEDILQDVFYQFADNEEPITQVTGWLYKVARNKITDSYRKQKLPLIEDLQPAAASEEGFDWKEILLATDDTPETSYIRNLFWDELQLALDELPAEQRDVFILNEMEGIPFKNIAEETGVSVATLISRKRYAVLHLRERLSVLKDELLNY
ncbi:MAG TPA: sigma-70 family RNA polymerase sigma factor [Ferruginibacter sp.]|jgi:RNA polymerase sigma factor (sigma-70 family)|nr:sigma-70 family RNA polymerase sigma factor [Ferruginibacter sp.]